MTMLLALLFLTACSNSSDNDEVVNVGPLASFTFECDGLDCDFDGSSSSDSDGNITRYQWSFGDEGVMASTTFAAGGTYAVILTVTDDDGASRSVTRNVTVNDKPVAAFSFTCVDLTCDFDASESSDSDGTIDSYAWSFGAKGEMISNTFAAAGTYEVTLTVTDNGGASNAVTQDVEVSNRNFTKFTKTQFSRDANSEPSEINDIPFEDPDADNEAAYDDLLVTN